MNREVNRIALATALAAGLAVGSSCPQTPARAEPVTSGANDTPRNIFERIHESTQGRPNQGQATPGGVLSCEKDSACANDGRGGGNEQPMCVRPKENEQKPYCPNAEPEPKKPQEEPLIS